MTLVALSGQHTAARAEMDKGIGLRHRPHKPNGTAAVYAKGCPPSGMCESWSLGNWEGRGKTAVALCAAKRMSQKTYKGERGCTPLGCRCLFTQKNGCGGKCHHSFFLPIFLYTVPHFAGV